MTQIDVLVHNYEGDDDRFFKKKMFAHTFFPQHCAFYVTTDHINHKSSKRINLKVPHCALIGSFFYCFVSCFFTFFFVSQFVPHYL